MKKLEPLNLSKIHPCVFEPSDNGINLPEVCKKCKRKKNDHQLINESHEGKMDNYKFILSILKLSLYDEIVKIALEAEAKKKKSSRHKPTAIPKL